MAARYIRFDFEGWRARVAERRRERRAELAAALRAGLVVEQLGTLWTVAGVISPRSGARAAFVEPFGSDPAYLAEHIENREYGLGFETWIVRTGGAK